MIRVLVLGGTGMLGSEVLRQLQLKDLEFIAPKSSDLDIRNIALVRKYVLDFKPNWIINCAAWTDVDGAEESFNGAIALNEIAVENIAVVATEIDSQVIHISTDYVFDGMSFSPYSESAKVNPINNYGESKLSGEIALLRIMPQKAYVIRTSWLYGIDGGNFVKTIAKKAIRKELVQVVDDQIGSPTYSGDLAIAITALLINPPATGIYNYSNEGSCSWYDLARFIYRQSGADPEFVQAISSTALNLKAKRPKYSLLTKEKWKSTDLSTIPRWEISLESILPQILNKIAVEEKL